MTAPAAARDATSPAPTAVVVGNSDGIGLAVTRRLLAAGWTVRGISRSPSPLLAPGADPLLERYHHDVVSVRDPRYPDALGAACDALARAHPRGALDVCIYCAGIGEPLDVGDLTGEAAVFEVNLLGAVRTVEVVVPRLLAAGSGHLIALSSLADRFLDPGAPSYSASKAGLSAYLEALALAVRPRGVAITNVRLGFVDTKMAKSEIKPFQIDVDRAARLVERCIARRPIRLTYPRRMAALLWLVGLPNRMRAAWT